MEWILAILQYSLLALTLISSLFIFGSLFIGSPAKAPKLQTQAMTSLSVRGTATEEHAMPEESIRIFSLYVMAEPSTPFIGYELLQALLAAGFRFGVMNIFHWYDDAPQSEKIPLFSLASATEPGFFDIDNIGSFSCEGLTLFMRVSPALSELEIQKRFNVMLETAQQLAQELNGVVHDSRHQLFTDLSMAISMKEIKQLFSYEPA